MRVIRIMHQDKVFYASLEDNKVRPLGKDMQSVEGIPLNQVQIMPLVLPSKIICVGLNYLAHAEELGKEVPEEPLLFLKPPSAIIGSGDIIVCPSKSGNVHYEGELAVVLGKTGKNIPAQDVPEYVFGYTCANDVTARDLQEKDIQYSRAKGFDTFCPLGPWIETDVPNPMDLTIRTMVNGEIKQESNTSDMINSPFELVSYISRVMTLYPGDVVLTGTPPGVGQIYPGDEVKIELEGIGMLINTVDKE